jgi:general secretion pathway protein G
MNRKKQEAFTLIELLLVLVILAALSAIVVPKFAGHSKEAKITAAKTDISNIEVALDTFEINTGRYPTTSEGLRALVVEPSNLRENEWKGPYLKRGLPMDPWGNEYVYRYPGQYNEYGYDLYSFGPDLVQGTDDDIKNWTEDQYSRR